MLGRCAAGAREAQIGVEVGGGRLAVRMGHRLRGEQLPETAARRKRQAGGLHRPSPAPRRRGPAGEAERDQGLQLGADRLREDRRRPVGGDADDQGRAVDDRAEGEIAERRLVDHIDGDAGGARRAGERAGLVIVREGADRDRRAGKIARLPGARMDDDRVNRII